jgi:hypothetical protein
MVRFVVLLLTVGLCMPAQPPPPAPEVERLESLIDELTALKSQVSQTEVKIDGLLRALCEQRGSLLSKPSYNALKLAPDDGGPAEVKKPLVRCKALTSSGKRCTRSAMDGQKYCKQHALAHQK